MQRCDFFKMLVAAFVAPFAAVAIPKGVDIPVTRSGYLSVIDSAPSGENLDFSHWVVERRDGADAPWETVSNNYKARYIVHPLCEGTKKYEYESWAFNHNGEIIEGMGKLPVIQVSGA